MRCYIRTCFKFRVTIDIQTTVLCLPEVREQTVPRVTELVSVPLVSCVLVLSPEAKRQPKVRCV